MQQGEKTSRHLEVQTLEPRQSSSSLLIMSSLFLFQFNHEVWLFRKFILSNITCNLEDRQVIKERKGEKGADTCAHRSWKDDWLMNWQMFGHELRIHLTWRRFINADTTGTCSQQMIIIWRGSPLQGFHIFPWSKIMDKPRGAYTFHILPRDKLITFTIFLIFSASLRLS